MSLNLINNFLERLNLFSTLKNGIENLNCAIFDSLKFGLSKKATNFIVAFFTDKLGRSKVGNITDFR